MVCDRGSGRNDGRGCSRGNGWNGSVVGESGRGCGRGTGGTSCKSLGITAWLNFRKISHDSTKTMSSLFVQVLK